MPGFTGFKGHTQQKSPRYYEGGLADEEMKQAARAQLFNELYGATALYNQTMGEKTPIADWLRKVQGGKQAMASASNTASSQPSNVWGGASGGGGVETGKYQTTSRAPVSAGGGASTDPNAAGGGASGVASGGPWAWLAAAIIANEADAKRGGYRPESKTDYAKDLFTGETMKTDFTERFPEALGIDMDNKYGRGINKIVGGAATGGRPGSELVKPKQMFKPYKEVLGGTKDIMANLAKDSTGGMSGKDMLDPLNLSKHLRKIV